MGGGGGSAPAAQPAPVIKKTEPQKSATRGGSNRKILGSMYLQQRRMTGTNGSVMGERATLG